MNGREIFVSEDLVVGIVTQQLLDSFLSVIDGLTSQSETLEALIEETQLLMTISGVSFYSSLLITAEIGETDRLTRQRKS